MTASTNRKGIHIAREYVAPDSLYMLNSLKNHSPHCLVHCICIAALLHMNTTRRPQGIPPVTLVSDEWEHDSFCFRFASFLSDYVTTIQLHFCWLSTMTQIKDILPCAGHRARYLSLLYVFSSVCTSLAWLAAATVKTAEWFSVSN